MRLIDADVFKEYIRESFEEAKGEFQTEKYLKIADSVTEGFLKDIDEQPTVEAKPVVKGEWKWDLDECGWAKHTCSSCGYEKLTDIHVSLGWDFCPNCGARMVKDND